VPIALPLVDSEIILSNMLIWFAGLLQNIKMLLTVLTSFFVCPVSAESGHWTQHW
jgi:hypothetical protein